MLRKLLGFIFHAVMQPARRDTPVQPIRSLAGVPVIFDLVSFVLQLRDFGRLRQIDRGLTEQDSHHRAAHKYNAGVTQSKWITTTRRAEVYYRMVRLAVPNPSAQRLLIVGPRNVQEILIAWIHGFRWRNIEAIDLYSTNSKITVMDMEAMRWPDGSFDVLTMSNTLSYAKDTFTALSEVARVLKPGGHFAFSATVNPGATVWVEDNVHGAQIADMLRKLGFEILSHFAADKINSSKVRQTSHAFLARKRPPGETRLDPFTL